ncbi:MAG: bifunctional precorrin-2 dehydrogenase/sirohydrochlorin ferrochelatase [Candidatus Bathyarchaeota archaeon]|nr:bifunctional precorrin-2 dehydrogenase/sirohydrochlorin ferrochelatase [Candidatus Bathyarchaeota archaeon]
MLIDLKLNGKAVMVIGGGAEATRKIQGFLDSGAKIWVISRDFSSEIQKLGEEKRVALLKTGIKDAQVFVDNLSPKPHVLLAATNNSALNLEMVKAAKHYGCMVYAVDNPEVSDFILPAVAHVGAVKIAVSTGGKSPAMAHVLRERVEKLITPQDLLAIQLQEKARAALKGKVVDQKERSKILYEILNNENIKKALSEGKTAEAEEIAIQLLEKGANEK